MVRAGVDGLARVSARQLAAARTLGATPWRAFWRVEWPVVAPWLASALCLVFLYCFTGFGMALVLGGQRWATVEVEIYTLVAHELALAQLPAGYQVHMAHIKRLKGQGQSTVSAVVWAWTESDLKRVQVRWTSSD